MKTLQVEVPERLDEQMDEVLKAGWFSDREEIVRLALMEFLRRQRFELIEQFQREDIRWAVGQKQARP